MTIEGIRNWGNNSALIIRDFAVNAVNRGALKPIYEKNPDRVVNAALVAFALLGAIGLYAAYKALSFVAKKVSGNSTNGDTP